MKEGCSCSAWRSTVHTFWPLGVRRPQGGTDGEGVAENVSVTDMEGGQGQAQGKALICPEGDEVLEGFYQLDEASKAAPQAKRSIWPVASPQQHDSLLWAPSRWVQ